MQGCWLRLAFAVVVAVLVVNWEETRTATLGHSGSHTHDHDCGTPEPTLDHVLEARRAELDLFGSHLRNLTTVDYSTIFQALLPNTDANVVSNGRSGIVDVDAATASTTGSKLLSGRIRPFRLVNVPIVYHVLPNQGQGLRRPSMTDAQRDYSTNFTTKLYHIYDKRSKESVQFVSFVTDQTIVHEDFVTTRDCQWLRLRDLGRLVRQVDDWQFKIHAIVCEFRQMSGVASSPLMFRPTSPLHNMFRMDHRALACIDYDTAGTLQTNSSISTNNNKTKSDAFLCNLTNGEAVSHSRWWRSRSVVLAHEIGHLLGLFHTFTGGCLLDDFTIRDTPAGSQKVGTFGCPGLLPYDKDRDLMERGTDARERVNTGGTAETCLGGAPNVCTVNDDGSTGVETLSNTCAACCIPEPGQNKCIEFLPNRESVSEAVLTSPDCCRQEKPVDSCKLRRGIDPLNNVMSYAPDFCMHEFTIGQMMSMMAQIRWFKRYMYCNYADVEDRILCRKVPCYSGATSPNCAKV